MGAATSKKNNDGHASSSVALNNKQLLSIPSDLYPQADKIDQMNLDVNAIKKIHQNVKQFTNLQRLSMAYNDVEEIPDEVTNLPLASLVLNNNQISQLPDTIGNLAPTLKTLYLHRNILHSLPPTFSSLTNLTKLNLDFNSFPAIPPPLFDLHSLVELSISGHLEIKAIPPEIQQLQQLEKLSINHLRLSEIPIELSLLPELAYLDVSINLLKKLPEGFGKNSKLSHLNVSYNEIEVFPKEILEMKNLNYINLTGNSTDFTGSEELQSIKGVKVTTPPVSSLICDNLYLGGIATTRTRAALNQLGITHVLSICYEEMVHYEDITYKQIQVTDTNSEDIKYHFPTTNSFIHNSILGGGTVLVHCNRGISRSGTVVIAYLMWLRRCTFKEALDDVVAKRDVVYPNGGFVRQLEEYEVEIKTQGS